MRKVGLGDGIKVREQVPAPRLFAFPRRVQCYLVCEWYGIAIVLAMFVTRYNGSHDDVQWYACITQAKCTFEDDLTLNGQDR